MFQIAKTRCHLYNIWSKFLFLNSLVQCPNVLAWHDMIWLRWCESVRLFLYSVSECTRLIPDCSYDLRNAEHHVCHMTQQHNTRNLFLIENHINQSVLSHSSSCAAGVLCRFVFDRQVETGSVQINSSTSIIFFLPSTSSLLQIFGRALPLRSCGLLQLWRRLPWVPNTHTEKNRGTQFKPTLPLYLLYLTLWLEVSSDGSKRHAEEETHWTRALCSVE